ncbi:MAG: cytochrome C biogenesis protein [Cycloclasticus sp. symbiont of Poecilosclerida sp. N]|nr:MAG: cytochrome C biogenesis protein [Cycloclasticus sp. symbiont of Poecilosclerida sp. N]
MSFAADQSNAPSNPLDTINSLFSGTSDTNYAELLEPDDAFSFDAYVDSDQQINLNWRIADGYYLYQEKVSVSLISPQGLTLKPLSFPAGKDKSDEIFAKTVVYYGSLSLKQLLATPISSPTDITLNVGFQGCADIGVCYPPMNKVVTLSLKPANSSTPLASISEQDQIASTLVSNAIWLTCLTFLGFGLLLSLTPCVFPMIPILSGIIIGHGESLTARKAFYLSLSYVVAAALTYALFGVLAGLFGSNLQATFQNPWILSSFSGVFVLLALSMFGLYEVQLPASIQSKLSSISQHQKHGSLWGSAVMGVLSALIVGPCVAAPLAGVLIYIGQTGDAILGGLALFSLGIGMGVPLIIIGMSAGKILPKAGHWMEPIKYFFGVLLLAVAIWLMDRILPPAITLSLWAGLLIVCAVYLKAIDRLPDNANGWQKLSKGLGTVFLIYGILLIVGAVSGGTNPLKPLANFNVSQQSTSQQHALPFQAIKSINELNDVLGKAAQQDQFVMLDFYADWCVSCKEMESYTFSDPNVQKALGNFILLQADVTQNDDKDRELLNAFSLIGPPAILFFKPSTGELTQQRVIGYMEAGLFLKRIKTLN